MKFEKIDCGNGIAVAVSSDSMIITDVDSALDLLMSAKYEAGTKYIVVDKKNIIEDFFILSSGLAGRVMDKILHWREKFFKSLSITVEKSLYTGIFHITPASR